MLRVYCLPGPAVPHQGADDFRAAVAPDRVELAGEPLGQIERDPGGGATGAASPGPPRRT
ncbi:MAG TPA: hypothetical protein VN493_17935 [Thermoanaerobaculia bacterium]|nr:hypothetical protein [Thermoanaerobaculia bacterium]